MSADIEARVRDALAAVADTQRPTPSWDDVTSRAATDDGAAHRRRWPLLAAAAALITVAVATYASLTSGPSLRRVDVRPSDGPVGATTTTLDPTTAIGLDASWSSFPEWGLVLRADDGTITVLGPSGSTLGTVRNPSFSATPGLTAPITGTGAELSITALPNASSAVNLIAGETAAQPAPPGCSQPTGYGLATGSPGVGDNYSVCGADARELWRTRNGGTSLLSGPPDWPASAGGAEGPMAGHWRNVVPSPDGAFVAAQWSGECESPMAFVAPEGGAMAPVLAEADGRLPESIHHGWSPDGRLILEVLPGVCGAAASMSPGVYLMSVTGGVPERITSFAVDAPSPQVWTWRKAG